ncbi:uncharacterized protein C8R40DRAFT_1145934 [Lentinula edodes]|uniref:uncharacterized protein n=1 Tax=Lentinula edodes TaxID=5353 RepID=UPI001E8EB66B|nr:uncharacterized protein C8R40DRAFT_1145934 [Lentinula edodes]KAH7876109.1 hypothetical protein C8R40DRAFT_1145934 [Lentinula edodes]
MQTDTPHALEYAPPDVRSPSPTSSVGSSHPEDQTSLSDSEGMLSQPQFEQKWESRIGLGQPSHRELDAMKDPLIARPTPGSEEEKMAFERILRNLRHEVNLLHENEMFEQTILRGSKAAAGTPVYTRDIDAIMNSMMGPTSTTVGFPSVTSTPFAAPSRSRSRPSTYHPSAHTDMTNGPWNDPEVTRGEFGAGMDSFVGVVHGNNMPMDPIGMMMPHPPPSADFGLTMPGSGRRNKGRASRR